jgi:hypothetical protein
VLELVDVITGLAAQAPADLPGPQAVADATVLLTELERLRALVLTRVADVDTRQLHTLADAPSTGTWLAAQQTSLTRTELAWPAASPPSRRRRSRRHRPAVRRRRRPRRRGARQGPPHVDRPDGLVDGQPRSRPSRPSSSTAS